MKKIIMSVIAVAAAAVLSSCMNTASDTVPAISPNEAYDMSIEKAAGFYTLAEMESFGDTTKDTYKVNTLKLNEDGTFEFTVSISEDAEPTPITGTYEVQKNGTISFSDDFAIVMKGESVVCNNEGSLTANSAIGRTSTITMKYVKGEEPVEESEEKEAEPIEDEVPAVEEEPADTEEETEQVTEPVSDEETEEVNSDTETNSEENN